MRYSGELYLPTEWEVGVVGWGAQGVGGWCVVGGAADWYEEVPDEGRSPAFHLGGVVRGWGVSMHRQIDEAREPPSQSIEGRLPISVDATVAGGKHATCDVVHLEAVRVSSCFAKARSRI